MKHIRLTLKQRKLAIKFIVLLLKGYINSYGKKIVWQMIEDKTMAIERLRWRRYYKLACDKLKKK